MKYNQYSYLSVDQKTFLCELKEISLTFPPTSQKKNCLKSARFTSLYKDTDYPLT